MNAFEQSKFSFKGEDDTEAEIRLPSDCGIANDEDLNIDDYLLTLNA
jgi:hypothetical protein